MVFATVALAASLLLALLLAAAPAGALVTTVGPTTVGVQSRSTLPGISPIVGHPLDREEFSNPSGNPIVSANKTYAIYWDPTDHYHDDWQSVIDGFFHNMGAVSGSYASGFAVDAQYTDKANQHALFKSTFEGAYTDTDPYPASGCKDPQPLEGQDLIGASIGKNAEGESEYEPVCLTDQQFRQELETFISQHSLQKGMETIFYILTPPGVTACLDGGGITGHCSDFVGTVSEMEKAEFARVTAEYNKEPYVESEDYKSYKDSFCSYHSEVNPTNLATGDENTILYGVVPWTAGGLGDGHLTPNDQATPAYDCQDGGYDPSAKPAGKHETAPDQQEPNQVKCPSEDGTCDKGLADLIVNQIASEQEDIVTNPLLDAWQDPYGNEATDECRNWFAPIIGGASAAEEGSDAGTLYNQVYGEGDYYLNTAFNLAALKLPYPAVPCIPGIILEPHFTAPNTVNANEIVGFDGMESDITLNAGTAYISNGHPQPDYATYSWNFGDGTPVVTGKAPGAPTVNSPGVTPCSEAWEAPCAASVYHSYQYGGTYDVTLTVTDVGGNTASVTEPITVDGPPPPPPAPAPTPSGTPAGGSGSGSSGSGGSGSGSSGGQTGTTSSVPVPVVTAAFASTSLKKVKSGGIPVHYTVNEQVAGSVQVLIESSVAKRLGIKGQLATGLAKGTPSETIIGTAVLVTTKAGTGTIHVKFASKTAARLASSHKLKLTLRLVARNASRTHPATTTTLSTVVFS